MLTKLRFKNWRSLRDVTIDNLTPITVFVGANSSGKTNILDALHFLRDAVSNGAFEILNSPETARKMRSLGVSEAEPVEIEFSFQPNKTSEQLTYTLILRTDDRGFTWFDERLIDSTNVVWMQSTGGQAEARDQDGKLVQANAPYDLALSAFGRTSAYPQIQSVFQFITQRWQLLNENFVSPLAASVAPSSFYASFDYELFTIHPSGRNVPFMLEFMRKNHRKLFKNLQSDLRWMLNYVQKLDTQSDERETRLLIKEKAHGGQDAPTISTGTRRLIAILTACYALDMLFPEASGLVAIEEPDTAIHPLLLDNLFELLRVYTEDRENPRQFILTTHNPLLLNEFGPEQVRIVERDEHGETTVNPVPREIMDIWLERDGIYRIGDVWTTRLLGGVPE